MPTFSLDTTIALIVWLKCISHSILTWLVSRAFASIMPQQLLVCEGLKKQKLVEYTGWVCTLHNTLGNVDMLNCYNQKVGIKYC